MVVPGRYIRASDFNGKLGQANNPDWKTVAIDQDDKVVLPNAPSDSAGRSRPRRCGQVEPGKQGSPQRRDRPTQAQPDGRRPARLHGGRGGFPRFGGIATPHFSANKRAEATGDVLVRKVPVRRIKLGKAGEERYALVATVFDLTVANYGVARGLLARTPPPALTTTRRTHPPGRKNHRRETRPVIAVAASLPTTPTRPGQEHGHHRRGHEPLVPQ